MGMGMRKSVDSSLHRRSADDLLYSAQRDALIGFDDTDRGVSPVAIQAMARRWKVRGVIVDVDETAPAGQAFAYPSLRLLRFHPTALVLWIAVHEVAHLVVGARFPHEPPHGPAFVESFLAQLRIECGADAANRLSDTIERHEALRDVWVPSPAIGS